MRSGHSEDTLRVFWVSQCVSSTGKPEFAICIDVSDPLDAVTDLQLQELCTDLRMKTEDLLSTLWMLRLKA